MNHPIYTPEALDRGATFFVAGHRGLVGSAMVRLLADEGFKNIVTASSSELDLRDRDSVFAFFAETTPRYVVLAAAKVGGIVANSTYPVEFISDNLRIQCNVLDAAREHGVERLLFLGSNCIYPKFAPQPIREDALLTGHLEPTNEPYAIAKIAGILHVQAVRREYGLPWISALPVNLYGPNDNFSEGASHVLPALIRRYVEAEASGVSEVTNWGTGSPRRELMQSDDMASACLFLLENYDGDEHVNVGTGTDLSIMDISTLIAELAGFDGITNWDISKPDGTPNKLLDVSKIESLGWSPKITMRAGLQQTMDWYKANKL